jgi:hypothetical protein
MVSAGRLPDGSQTFSSNMGVGGAIGGNPAATTPADNLSHFAFFVPATPAVPEPSSVALLATAIAGVVVTTRRSKTKKS